MTCSSSWVAALAAPLLLLVAASAAAAPPAKEAGGLGEALSGEARLQWQTGKDLYTRAASDGDFKEALAKFRRAYELIPDSRLLFNIAACEKQLKRYGDATRDLRRYLQQTPSLTIKDRDLATDILKALEPVVGEIVVQSTVDGAAVTLDNEPVGSTPIAGSTLVATGDHTLRATKNGMTPFETTFLVAGGGAPKVVSIVFAPDVHVAHVAVAASDHALIVIDGKPVGSDGHFEGPLEAGTHAVHIEAKGKMPHDEELTVRDDEPRTLNVTLQDQQNHGGVPLWAWVAGGVVVAGGLTTAGYFLFRPGDVAGTIPRGTLSPGYVTPTSLHFR